MFIIYSIIKINSAKFTLKIHIMQPCRFCRPFPPKFMQKLFFLFFIFSPIFLYSQENFSVFLLGDAGKDTSSNELLILLKKELSKNSNSAVVFLGDNIYPQGFLEKKNTKHKLERKRILAQLNILNEHKGSAFFIPGNHDWRIGKHNGKKAVIQVCNFVNSWCSENSTLKNKNSGVFCPAQGESGPVSVLLSEKVRLIMIDTQWWLHPFEANKFEKNLFLMKLDSVLALSASNGERALVAGHHPMYSNGRHAKRRVLTQFLVNYTPFQVFGLLGLNRLLTQDLYHPKYRKMRDSLIKIFEKYPGIIYAAGHEHNLQWNAPNDSTMEMPSNNSDDFFIVSGSGSKVTRLSEKKYSPVFSYDKGMGFFRIDFLEGGKFIVSAYTPLNGKLEKIYSAIF